MRLVRACILTGVLLLAGSSPVFADEPTASITPPTDTQDRNGEWWRCIEWDPTRGCNTGHYYHDGQSSTNWVLWIAPSGHRHWHPATVDVQSNNLYTDVYCPFRV